MPLLTFIIPIRHQDNAADWGKLKSKLSATMASIAGQTNGDWKAVIVANHGADLPEMPERFQVERVDFSPNLHHDRKTNAKDSFLDSFRVDKGRRVLKGMLAARDSQYFMIVDDDDFVSSRIVEFVSAHVGENGWKIDKGYVWTEDGKLLYAEDNFNNMCGTSLIIRSDLYALPERFEDGSMELITTMLGSHVRVGSALAKVGAPLASLPFRGAIYRVGNRGSHSQTPGVLQKFFLNKQQIRHPLTLIGNLRKLSLVNGAVAREFFGQ